MIGRSGLPLPAPLPRLLLPAHHSTLGDVMSREKFRWTAPFLASRVSRSSDGGTRKDHRARSRLDSSRDRGRRSRSRSAYRSRLSGRERRRRSSSRSLSSRERSRSLDRSRSRRVRLALGETGLDPRIDTGLAETALGVTGRGLLAATDPVDSVRVPLLAGELAVTARGHTISLVVLVAAHGLVDDLLPPLTVRGQRREDGEPDVSGRRVWRRLLSPRLLLSLKRLL